MKNAAKFWGIIALAAVIGFGVTGCEQPIDSPTVTTLTGITANYTGGSVAINTNVNSLKSNLTVTALYGNGATKTLGSTEYTLNGDLSASGQKTVTVIYAGKTTTFNVTVTAAPIADITYTATQTGGANSTANTTGIAFTFSASVTGLTADHISVTSGNGSLTKGALSGSGTSWTLGVTVITPGNVTVAIDKSGIEAEPKDVTVFMEGQANPTLDSISAVYTQGSTIIYPNTPLNDLKAGLTVTATYSTGAPQQVTAYSLSGTLTVGTSAVTVTYAGKITTFNVTVTAAPVNKTLTYITLNTDSVKKYYNQNETLDLTGLVVTANYSDGSSAEVSYTSTSPIHGSPLSTAETITVTVNYIEGTITRSNTFNVTVTAAPSEAGTPGLAYELITEGTNANTYRVRAGTVTDGAVVIPATYEGLPVTEIGSTSDSYDNGAFYNTSITSVTIPASVTSIRKYAFFFCTSLTSVTIPEGIMTISDYTFSGCSSLTNIIIPASVTYISYNAFRDCTSLTSVTIGEGVTSIGSSAFYGCTSLTGITIPEGVMYIDSQAFRDCTSLASITIPASVTSIGYGAFIDCTSLTSITIPASVTSIDSYVFQGCSSLTSITVDVNNPNYVSQDGILYNKAKTTIISVPQAISGNVTIPDSVTSIDTQAFRDCTSLTGVTIPEGVTSIGYEAFNGCTSLTSVTIPEGVTSIGNSAFNGCTSLTSVIIPEGVTSIASSAFRFCRSLASITIPASVTSIGYGAFNEWTNAQTIYVDGYASQAAANTAWGTDWRGNCNAVFVYYGIATEIVQLNRTVFFTGEQPGSIAATVRYNDNTTGTVAIPAANITGFDSTTTGTKTLTVTYRGITATFTVTVNEMLITNTTEWNNAITQLNGASSSVTLTIGGSFNVSGSTNNTFGTMASGSALTVTLKGSGTLTLSSSGNMLRIGENQTLIIDSENLILQGRSNNQSLVYVGGSLELRDGTIQNNSSTAGEGGGVYVGYGGSFIMSGGNISGNTASNGSGTTASGGGVYVAGTFTMSGGTISGNTTSSTGNSSSSSFNSRGGGVCVGSEYVHGQWVGGTFTMLSGTISGNTASASNSNTNSSNAYAQAYGGGVWRYMNGTIRVVNGTIYGNTESTTSLRNTVSRSSYSGSVGGAALYNDSGDGRGTGTSQRGTFSIPGDITSEWNSAGNLNGGNDTIIVVNGELQ